MGTGQTWKGSGLMAEVQGTPHSAPGVSGFMKNNTAGMPNWVWLLVIAGGIGLALAVKYYSSKKSATDTTTTGTDQTSGIGLAVDPTTGLPYAVEGLVPAGGTVGTGGTTIIPPTGGPTGIFPPNTHQPGTVFTGPTGVKHYVTTGNETLDQIGNKFGVGWNGIYAIPDNQKLFGKLNASQAKTYKPAALQIITVPGGGKSGPPTQAFELNPMWPGGTSQVRLYE